VTEDEELAAGRGTTVRTHARVKVGASLAALRVVGGRVAWLLVVLTLLTPFVFGLEREAFHGDESHWLTSSQLAYALIASGDVSSDTWRNQFYLYTQPQIGKFAIGAALSAGGVSGLTEVIEYDWLLDPESNRLRGAIPSDDALWLGRLPGAIAGWLAVIAIFAIGSAMGRSDVGLTSAVLLASHPLWLANARRTGMDSMAFLFGIATVYAAIRLAQSRRAYWWGVIGATVGLAAATKYTGLLGATGAALPLCVHMYGERSRGRLSECVLGAIGASVVGATVVFGTNPALFRDPIGGIGRSIDFFRDQAAAMRASFPTFASPTLVSLEIIDRAIWPIGVPRIVDTTLERSPDDLERRLNPGQYGTPIVGTGLALAVIAGLASRSRTPQSPLGSVGLASFTWFGITFVALADSLPIWWERWHLGIVPAACLLAAFGLGAIGRLAMTAGAVAQLIATASIGPSYLSHGFWDLIASPLGAGLHAIAVGAIIIATTTVYRLPERLKLRARIGAVPRAMFG
jgi:hypothetical protein